MNYTPSGQSTLKLASSLLFTLLTHTHEANRAGSHTALHQSNVGIQGVTRRLNLQKNLPIGVHTHLNLQMLVKCNDFLKAELHYSSASFSKLQSSISHTEGVHR